MLMHFAGPVEVGDIQQCCRRCGEILQPGPDIAVWPEGIPVVTATRGHFIPFEGVTPGQFPECRPEVLV